MNLQKLRDSLPKGDCRTMFDLFLTRPTQTPISLMAVAKRLNITMREAQAHKNTITNAMKNQE